MSLPALARPESVVKTLVDRVHSLPADVRAIHNDATIENPVIPVIPIVVVAVAAFVALAVVIGAIAAFVYYCQTHGGRWPGIGVPGPNGGYYSLRCIK